MAAVEELVWNALDADAREVRVDVITNPLGGVDAIRVADDGTGIDILRVKETFGSLGGSWKRGAEATPGRRRRLHGRRGCGRFKAFALGTRVEWRTTMDTGAGLVSYTISGEAGEPGVFRIEQAGAPGPATGTEVYITGIKANAAGLAEAGAAVRALAAKLAIYLKAYPDVAVYFCGLPVSPAIVQARAKTFRLTTEAGDDVRMEVIEWRRKFSGSGRLVFCGGDGFALHDRPAGVRPGWAYSFTAYLVSGRIGELAGQNMLVMDELHPEVRAYLDLSRKVLREYFRERASEDGAARLAKWLAEKSYPYEEADASEERARFDAGVAEMREKLDGFDSLPAAERKYLFGLLKRLAEKEGGE